VTLRAISLGLLAFVGASVAISAAPKPSPTLVDWTSRLKVADGQIRAGEFDAARLRVDAVLSEMREVVASGEGAGALFGLPLVLRAVARAGAGDLDGAAWDWAIAEALAADVRAVDLAAYGVAGERLIARRRAETAAQRAPSPPPPPAVPPRKLSGPPIAYPRAASLACAEGNLVVDVVVDPDGVPRRPRVATTPGNAALLLAGLEAVRDGRYRPGEIDGRPAAMDWTVKVAFGAQAACGPR
jgi:TonB family protein